jgi:superfamily II DNA or RNA helicase
MKIIKSSQYWLKEKDIEDVEVFKEKFTFIPKYKELKPVPTYTVADWFIGDGEVERYYGFPRNTVFDKSLDEVIHNTVKGETIDVPFIGELWEYQEPVILDFADKLKLGWTDLILSADTGSGKTVMLLKMWSMLKVPALVIVPKSDLMDQWRERIKQFTGLEDDDIGIARQNICQYENKKITIGMIHSLCKNKYSIDFKNHFGLVIFDELHKLGAFTFSQVGGMFPAKYRLGATATLRRADGLAKVFYAHLGKEVIKPLKGDQPEPKIVVTTYPRTSGKIPHWARGKVKRRGVLFSLLAKNAERNGWIASLANDVYSTDRQTLVLGERIMQLELIGDALTRIHGVPKREIGLYIGKTSPTERERIASTCKIILATTSMLSLGTDIPTLRGLVFATPLADVEQAIGRICRICADTKSPVVIDLVDATYPESLGWLQGRRKLYKRKEWETVFR